MKFIAIIPARYASTRFPGKPLALLGGRPVIQHVYEKAAQALDEAYVATDDERIARVVESFGGHAIMTRADHKSGTDRIEEAAEKIGTDADVVINIQGDEPFVDASQLKTLQSLFSNVRKRKLVHLENALTPWKLRKILTLRRLFATNRASPCILAVLSFRSYVDRNLNRGSTTIHISNILDFMPIVAKCSEKSPNFLSPPSNWQRVSNS